MRWADLGPTPGRHRNASTRRLVRGLSAIAGSAAPGLAPPHDGFDKPAAGGGHGA